MSITAAHVKEIRQEFAKLKPVKITLDSNRSMTVKEAVFALAPTQERMKKRGFDVQELAEKLREKGIDVKAPTLAKYLNEFRRQKERKGIRTMRGNRNRQRKDAALKSVSNSVSAPTLVPTLEECEAALLALAKQEAYKTDAYHQAQIKPCMEYFAEADMSTEAPRLKEMGRELSKRKP